MEVREQRYEPNRPAEISAKIFEELASRCQCMVELCPDAILVQKEGILVLVNPAFVQLVGANHENEVLGRSAFDFVHPDSREIVARCLERLVRSGEMNPPVAEKLVRMDGQVVEVEARAARIPWEGKSAIQVVLRDVSERKRLDEQLRESEAHFHELANSMPQIVWTADAGGCFEYHNMRYYEQTGLTEEEAADPAKLYKILHPEDVDAVLSRWRRCISTGEHFEMEYRYRFLKTGEFRWHLGRALPVRDQNGKIVRWFGTCTDIHEQKKTELALAKARKELSDQKSELEKQVAARTASLESSVRSMEDFCYSIAHNLRAPLRAMQGFATAMLEDHAPALGSAGQDYAIRIDRAAGHMDALIHDLLAYGRLNHQELVIAPVRLRPIVEKAVSHFEQDIRKQKAIIRLGNLEFVAQGHDSILEQIFANFISNALKFIRHDATPDIEIRAEEKEGMIRVWVNDNGIGIAEEHRKYIFRPFERLHPADQYPGTGIGLALAAKGAERLGGKVGLESEWGKGSRFWIDLPKAG